MTAKRSRRTRRRPAIANPFALAPAVAALRLPLMAAEAADASFSFDESRLAVTEKLAAAAEGVAAAQLSLAEASLRFWPEFFSGRVPSLISGAAAQRSMDAALKPAGKRVQANFRRLSRSG